MNTKLTQNRLKEVLDYDPETGVFTWKMNNGRRAISGKNAGCLIHGYLIIGIDGKQYRAHRLVWLYVYGKWPLDQIDHINLNRSDNRLSNLREATDAQNRQNIIHAKRDNKLGILGVTKRGNSYRARIIVDRKFITLGSFSSSEEAYAAYCFAKTMIHPYSTLAFELPQVAPERVQACVSMAQSALQEAEMEERDNSPISIAPDIGIYTS